MKFTRSLACFAPIFYALSAPVVHAADGTWTQTTSGGLWSDTLNWSGGIEADASGSTANFNTLDLAGDNTVRLDGARTLTNLVFGDTNTATPAGWLLDNNGNAANILTLAGTTPTITVNALGTGKNATISAVIAGSSGLTKAGAGTLVLSGANTYSGTTTINAGTLQLDFNATPNPTAGSSATYAISSGATLRLQNTSTTTNAAPPSWAKFSGAGTLALGSAKTFDFGWGTAALGAGFTGTLQIEGGRVITAAAAGGGLGGTTTVVIKNGGHLGMWQGGTFSQNFVIAGTGYGEGSGYNGALRLGNSGITTTINGSVTLAGNATLVAQTGGFGVINGTISESTAAGLTIGDTSAVAGTFTLTGTNTYTGATTVKAGTLSVATLANGGVASNIGASSNAAANLVFAGGTLLYTGGTTTIDRAFTATANSTLNVSNAATTLTIANNTAAAGGGVILTKTGAGTLVLGGSADNSSLFLALSAGTMELAKSGTTTRAAAGFSSIASGTTVKLTGSGGDQIYGGASGGNYGVNGLAGTIDLNGRSESVSNFAGTATGVVTNSAAATNVTWTVGEANATTTFAGTIQNGAGTVAVTKIGSGTQTFSGTNTYTGVTTVNAGTLALTGANCVAGAVTLNGGTLSLDYTSQNNSKLADGAALVLNGGTLQLAGATGDHTELAGAVTINGGVNLTRSGANTAKIALGNFTNNGLLNVTATGLATTTVANNGSGYLDNVMFNGNEFAMNDGSGNIIAATGVTYNDVTRLESGAKIIPGGAGSIVRIIDGTGSAPASITATDGATTDIGTLMHTATGGATTVDLTGVTGATLRLGVTGQILSAGTSSALTIQGGTLTAGGSDNTAGTLDIRNSSANAITVASKIADNGTGAVALNSVGSVTLTGLANTYTGGTTVNGGTLTASLGTTAGAKSAFGSGAITVNSGATLRFFAGGTGNAMSHANAINLNNATLISEDAVQTYSGAIALTGANTVNVVWSGKDAIFSNVVSGAGSLTKTGSGALVLSNSSNNYAGGTTVNGGTLTASLGNSAGAKSAFGSGAITVNSGATLRFFAGSTGNAMSHANAINLNNGTLTSEDAVQTYSGAIALTGANTVNVVWGGKDAIFSNVVSGAGSLTKTGSGGLNLTNSGNSYTGNTTISAGTLTVSGTGTLGGGNYAGAISNAGTFIKSSTAAQTLSGQLSGTGAYLFTGGTTTLSGGAAGTSSLRIDPTAAGTTVSITGGTYAFSGVQLFQNSITNSTATYNQSGGTVNVSGTFQLGASSAGGSSNDTNIANITGGALNVGTLSFYKWATSTMNISGGASVTAGTLDLGWVDSAPSGALNVGNGSSAGTLAWGDAIVRSNKNYTLGLDNGTLKATKNNTAWLAAGQFTTLAVKDAGGSIDNGGFNVTIAQVMSHGGTNPTDGGLNFKGAGVTTLTGTNTYNGTTVISAGTVITGNTAALGAGNVNITTAGAVLQIGNGTINTLTLGAAATLQTATDATLKLAAANSTITMTGIFNLGAGTNLDITGLGLGAGSYTIVDGSVAGSTVSSWDQSADLVGGNLSSFNYVFALVGNDAVLTVTAVPEPGAALLGGIGVLALLRRRRA